jgi:hypothetical protein
MGRGAAPPPLDVEVVRQTIAIRQDGALIRIQSRMTAFSGEPAIFQNMVCIRHGGTVRRLAPGRVAYALSTGRWPPRGVQVRLKTGDSDFRLENLEIVPACRHKPHLKGSPATSLARRQSADVQMLRVMTEHPDATVEELGELTGVARGRVSTRLGKLAKRDLVTSPMCVPGRAWAISAQGRTAAMELRPLLDDLDRHILLTLRTLAMGPLRLSRRIGTCEMTAKRRAQLLARHGLVFADMRGFFEVTEAGLAALGDAQPPKPWLRIEAVSAAMSREVVERSGSVDDRPARLRAAHLPLSVLEGGKTKMGAPSAWSEKRLTSERAKAG